MKSFFRKLVFSLAAGVLLSLSVCSLEAFAAVKLNSLKVTTVIDNIDDYPGLSGTSFTYEADAFYDYKTTSTGYISVPNVKKTADFTVRNGATVTLFSGGINDGRIGSNQIHDWCFYFMPKSSGTVTDNRLSFTSLEMVSGAAKYTYTNNGQRGTTSVDFFNYITATGSNPEVILHFQYNGEVKSTQTRFDPKLQYNKQIDWLGDGGNAETERDGANDYRLFLDAITDYEVAPEYKRKNIIFVLDCSGSMAYNMNGSQTSRVATNDQRMTKLKKQATEMITTLKQDPDNRYSVIKFAGCGNNECEVRKNKVSADEAIYAINQLSANGGTNYYTALSLINDCLDSMNDCENIVIFITDGEPTAVPESLVGNKSSGTDNEYPVALPYAVKEAHDLTPGAIKAFYSILINTNKGYGSALQTVSQAVNTEGDRASVMVSSESELKNVLDAITIKLTKRPSGLTISDILSENVVYAGNPRIYMESEEESRELLEGEEYILTAEGNLVQAEILAVAPKTCYTLSFDVCVSAEAVRKRTEGESYTAIGDPDTDRDPRGHRTSSGKPGFYSNEDATVSLAWSDGSADYIYQRPVIQVEMPEPISFDETFTKKLQNTDTDEFMPVKNQEFVFKLTGDGAPMTVANDIDGNITFKDIILPDLKDRLFKVEEIPGSDEHIVEYDSHAEEFTAHVDYDPLEGVLVLREVTFENSNDKTFLNKYHFTYAYVTLEAQKMLRDYNVTGEEADAGLSYTERTPAAEDFTFSLVGTLPGTNCEAQNDAAGLVTFPELEFRIPGTYTFTISEVLPNGCTVTDRTPAVPELPEGGPAAEEEDEDAPDEETGAVALGTEFRKIATRNKDPYIYDASEKHVTVTITADERRDLHAAWDYTDGNTFINSVWKKTGWTEPSEGSTSGDIILYGMKMSEGLFTFTLTDRETGRKIAEAGNDADGNITFHPMFGAPGDYDMILKQELPEDALSHMDYDLDTQYSVKVTVEPDSVDDGSLTAGEPEIEGRKTFENSYSVKTLVW